MVLSMEKWVGKVAVVTGASSGIGAAIAEALTTHGLTVVGMARRIERIQKLSEQISNKKGKLYGFKADVSKEEDILKAFKWIGENLGVVHVLVNSAGLSLEGLLIDGKTEDWKSVIDINFLSLCIITREAVKIMRENDINGHIIHMNSIFGHSIKSAYRVNVYPATKHAVTALTEMLRLELNTIGSKIKITSISPGLVATEMTVLNENISDEKRKMFESRPMLKGEDVADAVVYALSTPEHVQIHELMIKPVGEPC